MRASSFLRVTRSLRVVSVLDELVEDGDDERAAVTDDLHPAAPCTDERLVGARLLVEPLVGDERADPEEQQHADRRHRDRRGERQRIPEHPGRRGPRDEGEREGADQDQDHVH